jgi:hypothetical protein
MPSGVKKKKNTKQIRLEEIELLPDAWERFETGVKTIAKAPPKGGKPSVGRHRSGKGSKPKP